MIGTEPLVSILTPTFNHRKFITTCLASLKAQTYTRWQAVVVDDGSTDGTAELVLQFNDPRVTLIRRQHRGIDGLPEAYNTALHETDGSLVAVLEGDDFWPPDKLMAQLKMFNTSRVVFTWGFGEAVDEANKSIFQIAPLRVAHGARSMSVAELAPLLLLENFVAPASGVIIRRDVLDRAGGFVAPNAVPYVDWPTWLAVIASCDKDEEVRILDRTLVYWRKHLGQVSQDYLRLTRSRLAIADFIQALATPLVDQMEVPEKYLRAAVRYQCTRAAIAQGRWKQATQHLIESWSSRSRNLIMRNLVSAASIVSRTDLHRLLPRQDLLFDVPSTRALGRGDDGRTRGS